MLLDGFKAARYFRLLPEYVIASRPTKEALGLTATMERRRRRSKNASPFANKKHRDREVVAMLAVRGTCDPLNGIKPYVRYSPALALNPLGVDRLKMLRGYRLVKSIEKAYPMQG